MSRRKQPNPNKVKLMESSAEDKRPGRGGVRAALGGEEAEPTEEKDGPAPTQTRDEHTGSPGEVEESGADGEEEGEEGAEGADGVDLSSINAMMSTVMKAGQLNGGVDSASSTPIKTPCKSPTTTARTGRKNQEAKDETSTSFICPLCDKDCMTQHQLTMHIRQHNSDKGAMDHSCSICGKALSSASSLDRHMLVHSGERPYKCSVCGQTFTTNGNMHRHMKIHVKDPATSLPTSPPSPTKRRRSSAKRKPSHEEDGERADEPSSKRAVEESGMEEERRGEVERLPCPVCFKSFSYKHDLDGHMESHPDTTLRCDLCCISFRTHRGLLRHNAAIHKQLPTDASGRPFIQSNPSIPLGFNDLAFIDFSCRKFPRIAQVWCETNLRRCTSKFHRFVCEACDKAFPLRSALDLHKDTHQPAEGTKEPLPAQAPREELPAVEKAGFMDSLGLQHISQVKPAPSEEDALQAELDSIRVIRVEPPKSAQEAGLLGGLGLPLLDPSSLQCLSQCEALGLLSLQPFQAGFSLQPHGGMVVKPVCGEASVELADIQQMLKVASAAHNQIGLPPLSKAPCSASRSGYKQMPQLKPKPLVAPRTSMAASTPPPLLSTQQASMGCVSPSLPPPASQLLKTSSSSSSSSSSSGSQASMERMQMEAECMGDAHMPMDTGEHQIKQEEGETGKKGTGRKASYPCRFCDQVFAFSGVLQAHMRYHLGILPHQCNICDYVAPDKATLIRHLRTHSGERPYVCRVCHYPFTVKANCERHLRKKHMKNTRKEIEKNIKYVSSSTSSTQDALDQAGAGDATCRFCGEDLKTYRALQIHLRKHNGCQRKPFECRRCGAAFLAKRNCIHHLLKQHPEVQEQEIEEHIATLLPAASQASPNPPPLNGVSPSASVHPIKVEDLSFYSEDPDQPLDFSTKSRGGSSAGSRGGSPGIKVEGTSSAYDCSMEPIDLSVPKRTEKKLKREPDVEKEPPSASVLDRTPARAFQADKPVDEKPHQLGCRQLPLAVASVPNAVSSAPGRAQRLKPLLPKPASAPLKELPLLASAPLKELPPLASAPLKELPPLASIAQIISSVSGAPDLLRRDNSEKNANLDGLQAEGLPLEGSKRRCRRKPAVGQAEEKPVANAADSGAGSAVDLESGGELASVEKMLATADGNQFSPYLQPGMAEPMEKEGEQLGAGEEKEGQDERQQQAQPVQQQQSKVKKNAYSNSVQKMTCPFCPRVFPWASSLQRHMLTHTGQKPYPCPKCDAFFSTKSNCERHLLRKHGVANHGLRRNGGMPKGKDADDGSPDSSESMSDTEFPAGEAMDLSSSEPERPEAPDSQTSSPTKPTETAGVEQLSLRGEGRRSPCDSYWHATDSDDDSQSNKSLDLNFASKLIDFKFSEDERPQPSPVAPPPERPALLDEAKSTCKTCAKSFRYAATLARHQRAHLCHGPVAATPDEPAGPQDTAAEEEAEEEEEAATVEREGAGSAANSGSEDEKEERSDEEGGATEPKSSEGESRGGTGGKADKRKKICNVCNKRFWSLQDLTRHMRSHTGERPYKCPTCERTFTLKHSLVRHQRIHQKPRSSEGEGAGSEGECTPTSTNPPSENESEAPEGAREEPDEEPPAAAPAREVDGETPEEPPTEEEPAPESPEKPEKDVEASSGGFIQGLLEIHTTPALEHILPAGEPPLVGVE